MSWHRLAAAETKWALLRLCRTCAGSSTRRNGSSDESRVATRRSAALSALDTEPEALQFDSRNPLLLKGQPSSSRPAPLPLFAPHPEAEASSLGGAAQPELPDPEEAPSPASAMEPTVPSLTEEELTEVKKDVSSTTLPWRPADWGS